MTFANSLWREESGIEEIRTSIMTPDGIIETPEVVGQCKDTHDQALNIV